MRVRDMGKGRYLVFMEVMMQRGRATQGIFMVMGVFLLACVGEPGERSSGGCPEEEVCSDLTPNGLSFTANHVITGRSEDLGALAVGGTMHVFMMELEAAFDVTVDTDALTVAEGARADFVLTGEEEGKAMVRVVEEGTDLLFDRFLIEVLRATKVELLGREGDPVAALGRGCEHILWFQGFSEASGTPTPVFDNGLVVELDGEVVVEANIGTVFQVPTQGETLEFDVAFGDRTFPVVVPLVDVACD